VGLLVNLNWGTHATVKGFGAKSTTFDIDGGVCQGYNIVPTFFNLYLDFVTNQALAALGVEVGVRVAFKHVGKQLFANVQHMDSITWISSLLYAYNMVLIAKSIY
jgi:hypothetical protein